MTSLIEYLGELWEWWKEYALWLPRKVWELLLDGLAFVIESIPVPAWLDEANPLALVNPQIAYFADAFQFDVAITIFLSAYGIRFLIRRLPLVG